MTVDSPTRRRFSLKPRRAAGGGGWLAATAVVIAVAGCTAAARRVPELEPEPEPMLLGVVERAEIEAAFPEWVAAEVEAEPDREKAMRLARLGGDAEVTVFFGTWCSDSRRELARLWRALDELGGDPAFAIEYVGVDRSKIRPAERVEGVDLRYVPTFIVRVGGREVGRIVESAPGGIEADLAALLAGERQGLVTGRDDLESGDGEPVG